MLDLQKKDFLQKKDNFAVYADVKSRLLYGKRHKRPVVSIMIPTYLRNNYLKETIDSAINQNTNLHYEIVVVDNNPDLDDRSTLEVIRQYDPERVAYYKNGENLGMFGNWNRCIELSRAKWILILHDDDTIVPDYISEMMKIARKYPDSGCIGCNYTMIDENSAELPMPQESGKMQLIGKYLQRSSYRITLKDFYFVHPINIMGLLLNREAAVKIGGFDQTWHPASDYVFILNIADFFRIRYTDKALLNYRQAVNASLSPKHLIGMAEVEASMRQDLQRQKHYLKQEKHLVFQSALTVNHEKNFENLWFSSLSDAEKDTVLKEYEAFNNVAGIIETTEKQRHQAAQFQRYYMFWIKYLRK